ncbi:hypothetical protein; putative signal peptide [Bradyrhizobium sp. ORS 278]|uniref:hypothetical protein n=1 Tax=Bradyrhizobium sp. (strain ORS 278) TaxID=114615 RepID=UPI0001507E48|nr:hypothetical protein [Bradyrhizobium sp. ORS 278]CAL75201.1 hypothetical protein; putative signal peptide [Bradyrhizobium sp. ORS 278]
MSRLVRLSVIVCCVVAANLGSTGSPAAEQPAVSRPPMASGNPLWSMPLDQLSATRERPLFSPSRRPPPTEAPPPAVADVPVAPEPGPPERPSLALVGTVVNGDHGLAIFLDPGSKTPLRIRAGADYQGWTLRRVEARSVTLQKGDDLAVLRFASPAGPPATPIATTMAEVPSTQTAPPLAQAGAPYFSPESRLLRMHQRQRAGRRQ